MPEPLTPTGVVMENIYSQIFLAALLVSLFVFALLAYVVWRFRASSGHGRATHEHERDNLKAEMTWTIIPLFIMIWVGVISYQGLVALDSSFDDDDIEYNIGIVASKWNWRAVYEGGFDNGGFELTSSPSFSNGAERNFVNDENVFYLPSDTIIRFTVTSADILHAWALFDSNGAAVGMIDAAPSGPTQFNELEVILPDGEYWVKCKEHCFNPGHAYMRARVIAVPPAEFNGWADETRLTAGASVVAELGMLLSDGGVSTEGNYTVVKSSRVVMQVGNAEATDARLTSAELGLDITIPPNTLYRFAFDAPTPGTFTLMTPAGPVDLTVLDAESVTVELFEWGIEPANLQLQAGKTYLVNVVNSGDSDHNLFIGDLGARSAAFKSVDIAGGASTSFLVQGASAGLYDTWCNVPSHDDLGMVGTATVA